MIPNMSAIYINLYRCPTTYQTWHFFNNSKTNEDIATKQTHTTDTFLFISQTTNVLLFKSRCNIFIGFRIIKEMPGLVGTGTSCTTGAADCAYTVGLQSTKDMYLHTEYCTSSVLFADLEEITCQ